MAGRMLKAERRANNDSRAIMAQVDGRLGPHIFDSYKRLDCVGCPWKWFSAWNEWQSRTPFCLVARHSLRPPRSAFRDHQKDWTSEDLEAEFGEEPLVLSGFVSRKEVAAMRMARFEINRLWKNQQLLPLLQLGFYVGFGLSLQSWVLEQVLVDFVLVKGNIDWISAMSEKQLVNHWPRRADRSQV